MIFIIIITVIIWNSAYFVLSPELYKKKYSFLEPVLDETKAVNYIIGRGENPEEIYNVMQQEAFQGNEKVQLKLSLLFTADAFFNKEKQRMPDLLNQNREYF